MDTYRYTRTETHLGAQHRQTGADTHTRINRRQLSQCAAVCGVGCCYGNVVYIWQKVTKDSISLQLPAAKPWQKEGEGKLKPDSFLLFWEREGFEGGKEGEGQ